MRAEIVRITDHLKQMMKKQGYRYSDLAKVLKVSIPTVKRLLSQDGMSIDRLCLIADWLGVNLKDIIDASYATDSEFCDLTSEQEHFLANNPNICAYFCALRDGLTPIEIEKKYRLNRSSTNKYLLALDKKKLIEYHKDLRTRLILKKFIDLNRAPLLKKAFYSHMLESGTKHFMKKIDKSDSAYLCMDFFNISDKTYEELKIELDQLYVKYLVSSKYETQTNTNSEKEKISFIVLADRWQDEGFKKVIYNI